MISVEKIERITMRTRMPNQLVSLQIHLLERVLCSSPFVAQINLFSNETIFTLTKQKASSMLFR